MGNNRAIVKTGISSNGYRHVVVANTTLGHLVQELVPVIPAARLVPGFANQRFDLPGVQPKVVPALLTTFSSIMTEPKSFAPYLSAICPMAGPWVTQELWMFSMLSRKIRASACVRRYSATPVGCRS